MKRISYSQVQNGKRKQRVGSCCYEIKKKEVRKKHIQTSTEGITKLFLYYESPYIYTLGEELETRRGRL